MFEKTAKQIVEDALIRFLNTSLRRQGIRNILVTHCNNKIARVVHEDGTIGIVNPITLICK